MPGELVQIFVGQGGAQIADACWELFTQEHYITPKGECSACLCGQEQGDCDGSTFFSQTQRGFYVPRTLIVDTEPTVLDEIRMGIYRNLFLPTSLLSGYEDSASNFARGYYGTPCSLVDAAYNSIRHLAEACDLLHGILFYRTYGGGTGSGLGCRLLQYTADEFCKVSRMDFGVMPGVTLSSGPVEPYNAVLACQFPLDNVNLVSLVDNLALQRICSGQLKIQKPSFTSLNRVIAQCMSGLTSTFRFPGPTTITMMDLYTNLVPYPDAHFAMIGFAPLCDPETACKGQMDTTQLTESVFSPSNQLVHQSDDEVNMFLTCCLFYRGNACVRDVNTCIDEMRSSNRLPFVDWCPTGFKVGISYQPMTTIEASRIGPSDTSVIALHNSTLFKSPLHEITQATQTLLERSAFLHWFRAEGIDSDEIENALDGLKKLEADYDSFINNSKKQIPSATDSIMNDLSPTQSRDKADDDPKSSRLLTSKSTTTEKCDSTSSTARKRINPFCRREYDQNYKPSRERRGRSSSRTESGRTDCRDRDCTSRKSPLIINCTPRTYSVKVPTGGCASDSCRKNHDQQSSTKCDAPTTVWSQGSRTRSSLEDAACTKESDADCEEPRCTFSPTPENNEICYNRSDTKDSRPISDYSTQDYNYCPSPVCVDDEIEVCQCHIPQSVAAVYPEIAVDISAYESDSVCLASKRETKSRRSQRDKKPRYHQVECWSEYQCQEGMTGSEMFEEHTRDTKSPHRQQDKRPRHHQEECKQDGWNQYQCQGGLTRRDTCDEQSRETKSRHRQQEKKPKPYQEECKQDGWNQYQRQGGMTSRDTCDEQPRDTKSPHRQLDKKPRHHQEECKQDGWNQYQYQGGMTRRDTCDESRKQDINSPRWQHDKKPRNYQEECKQECWNEYQCQDSRPGGQICDERPRQETKSLRWSQDKKPKPCQEEYKQECWNQYQCQGGMTGREMCDESPKTPKYRDYSPSPSQYIGTSTISSPRDCDPSIRKALAIIDRAYEDCRRKTFRNGMSDAEPGFFKDADFNSFASDSMSQNIDLYIDYPMRNSGCQRASYRCESSCGSKRLKYHNNMERHNVGMNADDTVLFNYQRQFSPSPLPEDTSSTSVNLSAPSSTSISLSKLRQYLATHPSNCLNNPIRSHSSSMSTSANLNTSVLLNEEVMLELAKSVKSELSSMFNALGHVVLPPPTQQYVQVVETNQHHQRNRRHASHKHHHHHHHHHHTRRHHSSRSRVDENSDARTHQSRQDLLL